MSVIQFSCHCDSYNALYSHLTRKVLKDFLKKFWGKNLKNPHMCAISDESNLAAEDNSEIKRFKLYRQN